MSSAHNIYCKSCGIKIAYWSAFDNIQLEEEWECNGQFRRTCPPDSWIKGKSKYFGGDCPKGARQLKTEIKPCALYFDTKYCPICAKKQHYKCTRNRCNGRLLKVRNKDGSSTIYTHGGY